jgi:hypothetical protein
MDGGITEAHKLRWLLIQVAPETLLPVSDIFSECIRLAGRASTEYLEEAIGTESLLITPHLLPQPTLFCVLDEAQVLSKNLGHFRSDTDRAVGRPILSEILRSWRPILRNLIVSGTGISMSEVETVLGSVVAKQRDDKPETVTEIGGFDDKDGQRAYLEQYVPPGFLDTALGKDVASRVGYWLRGRFVFNAAV